MYFFTHLQNSHIADLGLQALLYLWLRQKKKIKKMPSRLYFTAHPFRWQNEICSPLHLLHPCLSTCSKWQSQGGEEKQSHLSLVKDYQGWRTCSILYWHIPDRGVQLFTGRDIIICGYIREVQENKTWGSCAAPVCRNLLFHSYGVSTNQNVHLKEGRPNILWEEGSIV